MITLFDFISLEKKRERDDIVKREYVGMHFPYIYITLSNPWVLVLVCAAYLLEWDNLNR